MFSSSGCPFRLDWPSYWALCFRMFEISLPLLKKGLRLNDQMCIKKNGSSNVPYDWGWLKRTLIQQLWIQSGIFPASRWRSKASWRPWWQKNWRTPHKTWACQLVPNLEKQAARAARAVATWFTGWSSQHYKRKQQPSRPYWPELLWLLGHCPRNMEHPMARHIELHPTASSPKKHHSITS